MRFITDFHIHSKYSRATSKQMDIENLNQWGQVKGINVIGTGDFTHPAWFAELQEKLEPAENGLFKIKDKYAKQANLNIPASCKSDMRFLLSAEISSIYKKNGKVRKMHNLVFAPSFEFAGRLNMQLDRIGNIRSDGRPILGLDAKNLLKMTLDISEDMMFVPAHAWTPHFSVFGSNSGFDTLEEAFEELTPYIYALETGLSSDPPMNWRLSQIENLALISNSDAHSPKKLGREANVFNAELNYFEIMQAIKDNDLKKFEYTIEFYPEEGKYHLDGHRDCGVCMLPEETKLNNYLCPKCGKKLTVGVLHRVDDLADHSHGYQPKNARPFKSIVPLAEMIAEIKQKGPQTKATETAYFDLINNLGNEFKILLDVPIKEIEKYSLPLLAEAIEKMRKGDICIHGGYDGEFGVVKIFKDKLEDQQKLC